MQLGRLRTCGSLSIQIYIRGLEAKATCTSCSLLSVHYDSYLRADGGYLYRVVG